MSNSNPILIRKYDDNINEYHLSVMSQQTTTATNRASVMHAIIHACYMSGLISRSVYIAIADSGPQGPWYIGATLYWNTLCNEVLYSLKQNSTSSRIRTLDLRIRSLSITHTLKQTITKQIQHMKHRHTNRKTATEELSRTGRLLNIISTVTFA